MFDVGQGNSQLIIFPSGFTILLDVAEQSWNSRRGAELVAEKIKAILGHTHINVGSASHWHLDHIGYVGNGGFWYLITSGLVTFDKFVDRDGAAWTGSGCCTLPESGELDNETAAQIEWRNVGTKSGTGDRWACWATDPCNPEIFDIREVATEGQSQFSPPATNDDPADSTVEVLMVDAHGVTMVDGVTPVEGDRRFWTDSNGKFMPPSENDFSVVLLVRHGNFTYLTGGDLDGEYAYSSFGYTYNDGESVVAPRVGEGQHVDLLQLNHHGSSHSTNAAYVDSLKPQASIVSCGENSYGHPDQKVLDRALAAGDVFIPNVCEPVRDYGRTRFTGGDIVVVSKDGGVTFTVDGVKYNSGALAQ